MNKYVLLLIMVFFLALITMTADSILVETSSDVIGDVTATNETTISNILGMLGTFFKILTFQLEGFPAWLNLLVFYPLTMATIYMIVDIFKDLVPLT